ncbi:uncharacterized protein LOC116025535 [Ipomoea triloba]|uniref:uncharacterized protein LOC116025535 n=1 Tax=Ipomoea triloba TaxID=35885 RepID=UPI00125DD567|nr:uncharacterized protein LOC116025535 [Ipomoea triloba]XP_031122642.1 uncharacterized protein LOC116025535 [Ipomoea triloba]XP_031122643.1 uncharacterized protein LOC116025535 [Ipomoea triloba]XP_031122644.1 uncharacterized protein LOC116025535 [Ipomoea triloba]XP_031122645.1 uncharacterized protein LOC116025535 [Ipomoea triloba]XP_031122646.1 uncharacterized protein LOC116025535 [Ipomoea triloba]XP_031122647.1 uncharacterized protein LOC116025535 [Ipomoea triloba]
MVQRDNPDLRAVGEAVFGLKLEVYDIKSYKKRDNPDLRAVGEAVFGLKLEVYYIKSYKKHRGRINIEGERHTQSRQSPWRKRTDPASISSPVHQRLLHSS